MFYKRFTYWRIHAIEQNPYQYEGESETGSSADFFQFKREEVA
jgi:hypothetical protein